MKKFVRRYSSYIKNIKLQYISDLHLEYRKGIIRFPIVGKYLALLGDIGNPYKDNYYDMLRYSSDHFENVFLISGNHEYWNHYGISMNEIDHKINNICDKLSNVHFLNNKTFSVNQKYIIVGSTLWTKISNKSKTIRGDDKYIFHSKNRRMVINNFNKLFENNLKFIKDQINIAKLTNKKIILLTHHLMTHKLIVPKYNKKPFIRIRDRYSNNLDYLLKNPIKYYLCGHSHCTYNTYINNVYCGINTFGYNNETKYYKNILDDKIKFIII